MSSSSPDVGVDTHTGRAFVIFASCGSDDPGDAILGFGDAAGIVQATRLDEPIAHEGQPLTPLEERERHHPLRLEQPPGRFRLAVLLVELADVAGGDRHQPSFVP